MLKRIFLLVLFTVVVMFHSMVWSQNILDGIVAIVGEEIVTRTELMQATQAYATQMGINPANQPDEFKNLMKDVLQNIINEKVLLIKAKEDTITVDDQKVETELNNRIQGLIDQMGSKEKVEAQFGSPIQMIKRDYRDDIRKSLTVQTVQQSKLAEIKVSRHEIEAFYSMMKDSIPDAKAVVKLRHIMMEIRPGEEARKNAVLRFEEIRQRLTNGEDFGELAKIYSEDPGTASRGGELGFVERGTLFQSFEEAAFNLEEGEISDVVETPIGLHMIRMIEKRGDKVNVRHILLRLDVTDNDESYVKNKIAEIRQRALDGEDFGKLASDYSDDMTTKDREGDLGWIPLEEMQIENFRNAVKQIDVNEITEPFKTQFGYHIVKMEDKQDARKITLENDWDQIKEWAWNVKRQKVLNAWIDELKENVFISVNNDMLEL